MSIAAPPSLARAAACYARAGWRIFPLVPRGKKPLTAHGLHDATADDAAVGRWWAEQPNANIGFAVPPGLLILDIDGDAGAITLEALEARYEPLPETRQSRTGGGGFHLFFALPQGAKARCSAGKLGPRLDTRADGGYVILPPSTHSSGKPYEWIDRRQPAPCPRWLLDLLNEPPRAQQAAPSADGVLEGKRHAHLISLAGRLRRAGAAPEAIVAALLAENEARCKPPKAEAEVRVLAEDVVRRYNPRPDAAGTNTAFAPVSLGELLAREYVPDSYVVGGLLACGGVSLLVAKPKVGKSTLARNLALAVARGDDFLGRTTAQGEVLYLALEEREQDVVADFRALGADGTEPIRIHAAGVPADALAAAVELVRQRTPRLLVVDTIIRLAHIRDEKAYAEVYAALGPLLDVAREVGTHIMLLHHAGKSPKTDAVDAPLGSTALAGAVSTLIVIKRTEAYRTIQTVQRCGQDMPETVLAFDAGTKRQTLAGTRAEADRSGAGEEILDHLWDAGPQTRTQIEEAVGGRTGAKRAALKALVAAGVVTRAGDGTRGSQFVFSCSQGISGTREQETQNEGPARINTGEKVVPDFEPKPIVVPKNLEPEKPLSEGVLI